MVMIDINEYMNSIADKYSNTLGFASDTAEPMANSHSKQVPGYDEILPCACEECLDKFLLDMQQHYITAEGECTCPECIAELNDFGDEDYEVMSPGEYLGESLDEATIEVIENLAFLGDGTTTKDVMISILALEATVAQIKMYLLESE